MKNLVLLSFFIFLLQLCSNAQQYTPSTSWGNSFKRLAITQADTVGTKVAGSLTVINGTLYIANGTKWSQVTGGGGSTDSLVFATLARLYKVIDSVNTKYSSNVGNTNLRLTGDRKLSGGAGASNGYSFTYDSLASFNLTRKSDGLDYFYVGQDGEFIIKNILNESFKIDSYGGVLMQSANNAEDDMPTRVTLSAQQDTATFTFSSTTKIKAEKVNPNNGSSYKLVALNDATKEFETVASVNVDTTNRTTGIRSNARAIGDSLVLSAAINAKPNFGDIRDEINDSLNPIRAKILADSIQAASVSAGKVNITDSASMLSGYRNASILSSGTVADARLSSNVDLLNAAQTITADKVSTGLTTARANGLAATQDLTKGLFLQNQTASTAGVPQQISPAIVWQSNAWNTGASGGGLAGGGGGANNEFYWRVEQRATSGNGAAATDNKLVFMQKFGTNAWVDRVEFNRDGIVAPISGNTITLGTVGANGTLNLRRSTDGGLMGSAAASNGGITFLSGSAGINVLNSNYTAFTSNPNNGMRYTNANGLYVTTAGNLGLTPSSRLVVDANASIGANVAAPTNGLLVAGNTGLAGITSVTAKLHIAAGSTSAGSAPIKLTSSAGAVMSTPEDGAVEFDGTNYFVTSSTTRFTLAKTLTATATLDFPNTSANGINDLTITVTGAADGDVVMVGVPSASATDGTYFGFVSATNTVTVRFHNSGGGSHDPASGTFRVSIIKY